MNNLTKNEALMKLKPICDEIIKNPTVNKIIELENLLDNINSHTLNDFKIYISYPLLEHIKRKQCNTEIKLAILKVLKKIFEINKTEDISSFFNFYVIILGQIYTNTTDSSVANVCEELKLSTILCLNSLIRSISIFCLEELYQKEHVPKLSLGVFLCVKLAQIEKLRQLRIAAIEFIMLLAYVHDEADKSDLVLRYQIADVFMYFLPGIIIGLQDVISGDDKQGYMITMMALRAWSQILTLVLSDKLTPVNMENNEIDAKLENWKNLGQNKMENYLKGTKRDKLWYKNTIEKVLIIFKVLVKVRQHSNYKVRLELCLTCKSILDNCIINLKDSIIEAIETLITLSEDEYEVVSTSSKNIINEFLEKYSKSDICENFIEKLEEKFFDLVTTLPRIFNSLDTSQQISSMNLLVGYLDIFKKNNNFSIFNSVIQLEHFFEALILISQIDSSDIPILEQYSIKDFSIEKNTKNQWSQLKLMKEKQVKEKFLKLCQILGDDTQTTEKFTNYLLDKFNLNLDNQKEIILILNEIISAPKKLDDELYHILSGTLEVYLDTENWYLSTNSTDVESSTFAIKQNIILMCLLTDGIGKFALLIQKNFSQFLIRTLYFLIERAGSKQPLLSESGIIALKNVCESMECLDMNEFLKNNSDYLSYHIVVKLRKIDRYPGVLDVLTFIMQTSSIDILPCLQDIVNDVLLQSFDEFQKKNLLAFLQVFQSFVICVERWQKENPEIFESYSKTPTKTDLDENEKEPVHNETLEDGVNNLENNMNKEYIENEEKNLKIELPSEIKLTCDVLKRTLHFLPSKNQTKKLIVIDTLIHGVNVIKNFEDELLPIVHQIWEPLVDRFKETNEFLIINKSLMLLKMLADNSKSFIRHRTARDVLTPLYDILQTSAKNSRLKDRGAAYRYSQQYKLQLAILNNLAEILIEIDVADEHLVKASLAVTPYLSSLQPIPLQESCLKFLKTLCEINNETINQSIVEWLSKNKDCKEFNKNIEILLNIFK